MLAVIDFAGAYSLNGRGLRCLHKKSYTLTKMATASEPVLADDLQTATDLTNHKLWCTVDGFNAVGVNCALVLEEGFKVKFTKGISAYSDGFWRVIKMTDGSEVIEATHPIIPEYMLLFDIWEPNILWRGQLNKETMTVSEGQVITNKKRLGIFPYTEVIATVMILLERMFRFQIVTCACFVVYCPGISPGHSPSRGYAPLSRGSAVLSSRGL